MFKALKYNSDKFSLPQGTTNLTFFNRTLTPY
jgi:hypothetical protein